METERSRELKLARSDNVASGRPVGGFGKTKFQVKMSVWPVLFAEGFDLKKNFRVGFDTCAKR